MAVEEVVQLNGKLENIKNVLEKTLNDRPDKITFDTD
jgi:hypothetical protein